MPPGTPFATACVALLIPEPGPRMPDTPESPSRFLRVLSTSRYLIFLAVIAILAAATSLLIYGGWETFGIIRSILDPTLTGPKGSKALVLAFIEVTDLFLLATVLY